MHNFFLRLLLGAWLGAIFKNNSVPGASERVYLSAVEPYKHTWSIVEEDVQIFVVGSRLVVVAISSRRLLAG